MSLRRLGRAVMHGGDYDWGIGIAAGVIALLALIGGSNFGRIADYGTVKIHHPTLRDVLVSAG
ncbi:MAG TPA: hypothetical protein VFN60_07300, partial [Acidimicrobiales bacterium]|nr:hypothetical protein [Acidimicrobiales bacterium]